MPFRAFISREMVRTDTGGKSRIPFVVRNDASHSDILFQTSDATLGGLQLLRHPTSPLSGKSLYDGIGQPTQADAVSYNRPISRGRRPDHTPPSTRFSIPNIR